MGNGDFIYLDKIYNSDKEDKLSILKNSIDKMSQEGVLYAFLYVSERGPVDCVGWMIENVGGEDLEENSREKIAKNLLERRDVKYLEEFIDKFKLSSNPSNIFIDACKLGFDDIIEMLFKNKTYQLTKEEISSGFVEAIKRNHQKTVEILSKKSNIRTLNEIIVWRMFTLGMDEDKVTKDEYTSIGTLLLEVGIRGDKEAVKESVGLVIKTRNTKLIDMAMECVGWEKIKPTIQDFKSNFFYEYEKDNPAYIYFLNKAKSMEDSEVLHRKMKDGREQRKVRRVGKI